MDNTYSIEKLSDNIEIVVSNDHKFGTDAFLLADFTAPRKIDKCCDIGTGCGIIPFIWCKNTQGKHIFAIDIQSKAIDQLKLTLKKCADKFGNGQLIEKITPILQDIKNISLLKEQIDFGTLDVVACNPPYKIQGAGIISDSESDKIARHETACTIDDICFAASKMLKFGGRLCVCQRPERLADVITAMKNNNIEPKRLRFVSKDAKRAPFLFLIEGKKGSSSFMKVLPPLFTCSDNNNEFSEELLKIYGKI